MKIAIVGSRKIRISYSIAERIGKVVSGLRAGDTLLLRSPDGERPTSDFEMSAALQARKRDANIALFVPDESDRASIYRRDYELVLAADEVLAYFPAGADLEGGTWHVVHAAMQKGIPCRAFMIAQDGRTELIGSEDGEPALDYAYS